MTHATDTAELIRTTARAFAARHSPTLAQAEDDVVARLPECILAEIADLGWLDANSDEQETTTTSVLATLVFELARVSPPLGARLLCHHFAREWLHAGCGTTSQLPGFATSWLSVPAFAPQSPGRESLATMVVGLHESRSLLCVTHSDAETPTLLLMPCCTLGASSPVQTLGLHGLSLVDVRLPSAAVAAAQVICKGPFVKTARATAWQRVLPAYVSLCRAVIATSLHTALAHCACRHQGGGLLRGLPQVRAMLETMQGDLALVTLVEQSALAGNDNTVLLARVRQALLSATDAGIQVLGGAGYVVGTGQERLWRDARQLATLFVPPWTELGSDE